MIFKAFCWKVVDWSGGCSTTVGVTGYVRFTQGAYSGWGGFVPEPHGKRASWSGNQLGFSWIADFTLEDDLTW